MAKRRRSNPNGGSKVGVVMVTAALAYIGWCAFSYSQTSNWSWAPWKYLNLGAP